MNWKEAATIFVALTTLLVGGITHAYSTFASKDELHSIKADLVRIEEKLDRALFLRKH